MKHVKLYENFKVNEDWGSSDQTAMNQSMHKSLGEPKEFPGLDQILSAAEEAVDFYWDEWPEYQTQREELINDAGRRYMRAYFPVLFKGFTEMFSESLKESHTQSWELKDVSKLKNYMFFQNLIIIRDAAQDILAMDRQYVDSILDNGHGWATDHVSTSKDDIEEVAGFLKNYSEKLDN
jgi:hypothetical protein